MQNFSQYQILPTSTGEYPPTGNGQIVDRQSYAKHLRTSALRLNCIAELLEIYEKPGGLEEAVKTLEEIVKFYAETNTTTK